jgi:hypothetical protein
LPIHQSVCFCNSNCAFLIQSLKSLFHARLNDEVGQAKKQRCKEAKIVARIRRHFTQRSKGTKKQRLEWNGKKMGCQ